MKSAKHTIRELTAHELDAVAGGAGQTWYSEQTNGGGQTPQGDANGVPTSTYNNGGHLKSVS